MTKLTLCTAFTSMLLLATCGQQSNSGGQAQTANASSAAEAPVGMGKMPMAAAGKAAKGSGIVAGLDKTAGKITLKHGPLPEANWPAMTMTFDAKPQVLDGLVLGDQVDFDVLLKGGAGEVTAAHKR
jgi:Cu(I)/Ag(I) efflux system protein CusF